MESHYHIENMVVSLAGNVDESAIPLLEQHFGQYKNHGAVSELPLPQFCSDPIYYQKKTEQAHICLSLPGCAVDDPRMYGMILLNNVIGGGMSSRLFQEIREKRGLAYSVYSYHSAHQDSGMFTIYAGTAPKQTKEVLQVMIDLLQQLILTGISDSELRRGKEQLKGSLILSLESTSSRMNRLGKNELMTGIHYSLDEIISKIEHVNMGEIQSLIEQMFSSPFALAMVGASNKSISTFRRDQLVIQRSN